MSQADNARKRRLYAERKEKGICVRCGKVKADHGTTCEACSEKNRRTLRETREFLLAHHICVRCRKEKAVKGKTFCLVCCGDSNERRKKYYAEHRKEILSKTDNKKRRERNKELKAKGICTRCHTKKATPGFVTCADCRIRDTRARRIRDSKKRDTVDYETAITMNVCTACRVNAATHGKLCDTCYERAMSNLGSNRRTSNHYWVQDNTAMFVVNAKRARA